MTPSGIEPATFRVIKQSLNQLRYGVPLCRYTAGITSSIHMISVLNLSNRGNCVVSFSFRPFTYMKGSKITIESTRILFYDRSLASFKASPQESSIYRFLFQLSVLLISLRVYSGCLFLFLQPLNKRQKSDMDVIFSLHSLASS